MSRASRLGYLAAIAVQFRPPGPLPASSRWRHRRAGHHPFRPPHLFPNLVRSSSATPQNNKVVLFLHLAPHWHWSRVTCTTPLRSVQARNSLVFHMKLVDGCSTQKGIPAAANWSINPRHAWASAFPASKSFLSRSCCDASGTPHGKSAVRMTDVRQRATLQDVHGGDKQAANTWPRRMSSRLLCRTLFLSKS